MNALEIKGISKTYDNFKLDNLNLNLPRGCIMGLIGENGAGKTTIIKLILDMIKKDSGTITVLGRDNQDHFELTKQNVGVVLDEVGLPSHMDAEEIEKFLCLTFTNWDSDAYKKYLKEFSIPEKNVKFKEFSKGTKMKLGLAIALSHHAELLILDEATAGLDPVVRDKVIDILSEFTRDENHSVLMSSHIVSDLEKICDYIAFMHKGQLMLCEEKDRLTEEYGIIHCTEAQLNELNPEAIRGKTVSPYGIEALVLRDKIPSNLETGTVSIEELFLFMVKETA